jgi:hypothetical protein
MASDASSNRRIGRIIVGAFVAALVLAILWLFVVQSGVVPGDSGENQPGTVTSE